MAAKLLPAAVVGCVVHGGRHLMSLLTVRSMLPATLIALVYV